MRNPCGTVDFALYWKDGREINREKYVSRGEGVRVHLVQAKEAVLLPLLIPCNSATAA